MIIRKALWRLVSSVTWLKKRQRVEAREGLVKVTLKSVLCFVPGWMSVDGNVHAMCLRWPTTLLCWLHKHSDCRNTHSKDEYLLVLRKNQIVHHGLNYGVPNGYATVDVNYSSHFIKHLFRKDAEALLRDAYRAFKKSGRIRVAVPDLEYAEKLYQKGAREEAMAFFFRLTGDSYLNRHHCM